MARTDAIVLGAGIVGTAVALHLAKRGLAVALVDRRDPGQETSFGNAGIIEGSTIFPPLFPSGLGALVRIALGRAPEANYHAAALPRALPWLFAYRAWSRPDRLATTVRLTRPLYAAAIAEHERLMDEAKASHLLRKTGFLLLCRDDRGLAAIEAECEFAAQFRVPCRILDADGMCALEPSLAPVARHGLLWEEDASVSDPLALTRAYAARFAGIGGIVLTGDARSLHRVDRRWRVETAEGFVDADQVVVALGPWSPDVLEPLGIRLPMAVKRGYHRHFRPRGEAGLSRPMVDLDHGYCLAAMPGGIRLTTGVEIADRDAVATPVQLDRVLPAARALFPLGEPADAPVWMGSRPCFADSRPVVGPAPGQPGLWLAFGHAHWGLTLAAVTGRLLAEMITGAQPLVDPTPFGAERFG